MMDCNRLAEDLSTYLDAKLPDVDLAIKMETSEYISNRVTRFLQDALWERDKEWRNYIKRDSNRIYREFKNKLKEQGQTNG